MALLKANGSSDSKRQQEEILHIHKAPSKLVLGFVGAIVSMAAMGTLVTNRLGAHGGDNSLIHTCVHDRIGVVKIVTPDESCPSGWTALDWDSQGPAGPAGAAGPPGVDGAQGRGGVVGAAGPTGAQGRRGLTGAAGVPGPAGAKGDKGSIGAQGQKGLTGSPGVPGPAGVKGTKGDTGAKGNTGAPGPAGSQGSPGITGYERINSDQTSGGLITLSANESNKIIDVPCPSGKKVLRGGINASTGVEIVSNQPISSTAWRGRMNNNNNFSVSVRVHIICANVSP